MAPRLIATDIRELLPMRRAPGNHVSTIINNLAVRLGKWDPREEDDQPPQLQFETGSAFEDAIAEGLAKRYARDNPHRFIHGLELSLDGITGNLDLLDCERWRTIEVKLTKMSIRHDIEGEKFWHYWKQAMSYVWMVRQIYKVPIDTAELHVGFVMGDWKWGSPLHGWQYRAWEDSWSEQELANHWRMMVGHKL